ncbi:hypothetical protein [Bradyrhizobium sp. SSUT18]|uniref:hypothetical protein n=1 Tax=Bradyrhizobium sp. SSUT18 TaxID=3040602 RepID=UPI003264A126
MSTGEAACFIATRYHLQVRFNANAVSGAAQATDAARVTASAEKTWLNGWSVAATFLGEFSNFTRSYASRGVLKYQ